MPVQALSSLVHLQEGCCDSVAHCGCRMGEARSKASLALYLHDTVNVSALPVLGGLCIAALLGYFDASKVCTAAPASQTSPCLFRRSMHAQEPMPVKTSRSCTDNQLGLVAESCEACMMFLMLFEIRCSPHMCHSKCIGQMTNPIWDVTGHGHLSPVRSGGLHLDHSAAK